MKHKFLLLLLAAGMTLGVTAQQTSESFIAKDGGQQQVFLLEDNPRLTVTIEDDEPVFTVRDLRNRVMNGVTTCIFSETALSPDITLRENENADYYTQFAQDYNGVTVTTATLNRQFTQGQWATLCLPFNVNKAMMTSLGLYNRVFAFRYSERLDDETMQMFFAPAQSIEAGKGYIVNANAKLAEKTSFVFPNVTINTDADNADITALTGYNDESGRGSLYLVGTLRTGVLRGSEYGDTYLGLKDNVLYYPNGTSGTGVRAYRGFFRKHSAVVIEPGDGGDALIPQRVRIVVDGVDKGELRMDNGEWQEDNDAVKYIRNGVLYIFRNGKTYNAQGQVID